MEKENVGKINKDQPAERYGFWEAVKKRAKKISKRIFPPSANHIEQRFKGIEASIEGLFTQNQQVINILAEYKEKIDELENTNREILSLTREIAWSEIFNNTITDSEWLKDKAFSPGRWAAGYGFMYILYRVLDEIKPECILETGLGQSTKMITQFAVKNSCDHTVIEQDESWIEFFKKNYALSSNTKLLHLPAVEVNYLEDNVLVYKGFAQSVLGKKFDLICIDGPGKSKAKLYARIDLLEVIPDVLADRWVILWDDYDLPRARNTYHLLVEKLKDANLAFCEGEYAGSRTVRCLCSKNLGFLTTL